MKRYTLFICILFSLYSCKEEEGRHEEEIRIEFEKEQLKETPPTFDPVGVWEIYMEKYIVGISQTQNMLESIENGKNKHLYYQLLEDHTYIRCMVEDVDSVNTEVATERGRWQQAGDIVRLTSESNEQTDYKVGEARDYRNITEYCAEFFTPYKNKTLFNHVWLTRLINSFEVRSEATSYFSFPFKRLDIVSLRYLQWKNTLWCISPDGNLDVYTLSHRSGYHEEDSKYIANKMLVLHNHGTLKIDQYEGCDSVEIYIEDYEIVKKGIIHPRATYYPEATEEEWFPYLLPGRHRYPIEYGSKYACIFRDDENLSPITLEYETKWNWDLEHGRFYEVPSTFDFSEYTHYAY